MCMRCADAIRMMENPPKRVRMTLEGSSFDNTSRCVTAYIKGSKYPDEILLMTAHYDSTIFGCGAWDNATGSANILEMYRYYLENPPARSIRFLWCGSEEQGLLGSTAYAEAHPEEVEKFVVCMNFDMTGPRIGSNLTLLTGDDELRQFVKLAAREAGYTSKFQNAVHSSDSAPFCLRGVPGIGFARDGQATGHNRNDIPWPLCGEKLKEATDFAKLLADRIHASVLVPFKRNMPDDMKKELERYFLRGRPAPTEKEKAKA